jgi:uncharacterized cupredoxin-like copper-binding protein
MRRINSRIVDGSYELYCPIGDHKDRGMTTDVEISG